MELARDPVSCLRGDIFCRECALANLLAQKKELKRAERVRREAQGEAARAQVAQDEEDQKFLVQNFELTQAGLADAKRRGISDKYSSRDQEVSASHAGSKRKFALDEDELIRIAKDDKAKARKAIDEEKVNYSPTTPLYSTLLYMPHHTVCDQW